MKAPNARAERAEERARVNALRAQIDELNAALAAAHARADRALTGERQRADRLNEQVKALAERAEAGRDAERARAEALRSTIDELMAGQAMMTEMHARELAVARHDAHAAKQAIAELRRAEAERTARGRWARLRTAWRGE